MQKKLPDQRVEKAETCSGIQEKAALLEGGFHLLGALAGNDTAKKQAQFSAKTKK